MTFEDARLLEQTTPRARLLEDATLVRVTEDYAAAGVVYGDDFNRADGALGAGWHYDNWTVSGNAAFKPGGNDFATFKTDVGSADHWVESFLTINGTANFGVINARRPSATDDVFSATCYMGFWSPSGGGGVDAYVIAKTVAGSYAQLVVGTSASGVTSVKLRLEVEGTAIRLYANDVLVASTTDSSITSGNFVGFNCNTGPLYDWMRCGALPYTAP